MKLWGRKKYESMCGEVWINVCEKYESMCVRSMNQCMETYESMYGDVWINVCEKNESMGVRSMNQCVWEVWISLCRIMDQCVENHESVFGELCTRKLMKNYESMYEKSWINVCSIELYELNQSYMNRLICTVKTIISNITLNFRKLELLLLKCSAGEV